LPITNLLIPPDHACTISRLKEESLGKSFLSVPLCDLRVSVVRLLYKHSPQSTEINFPDSLLKTGIYSFPPDIEIASRDFFQKLNAPRHS